MPRADPDLEASAGRCSCASRSTPPSTRHSSGAERRGRRAVLGEAPQLSGARYWADSAFIAAAGIPTAAVRPGGEGAHALEEWVSI